MNRHGINQQRQCMGCMEFYDAAYDICPHCGYEDGQKAMEPLHIDPGILLANRYIIGRALGYGGFGVTYLAWDTQLKRKLAIKEYLPSEFATRMIHHQDLIVANNEKKHQQYMDGMKKFLQEGQKLAQVSNIDGIVHMYDCFEANNTAYITMEYLEGETLAAFLDREGKISEQQAMDYILPVMQALETVHEKGIIHRDIAPDNIFLSRDASGELKVKLIDFGAAKFATTSHSKSLTVIIKPGYSPEEQYRSNGDQGTYTDVYALAAVLYRMVTGVQPPDAFERRTMIESKKRDLLEEPSKYNRELSANFENALLNAMNVRIEDRTATIAEFEEELISFEPVKRRGSSIRRIDFMRWPLWAKIGVPVGSVAALALLIWGLIAVFTNPVTSYELPEGMTRVPDFVTADFEKAQQWADEAVLLIGSTGTEYVPNAAENVVLRQDVYSGAVVLENTMVSVVVSTGEESYYLPDVTGMEIEAARKALECMGLEIVVTPCGQVNGLAANCVVSQDIEPYTVVKTGDTITINVTDSGSSTDGTACKLTGLGYSEALEAAAGAGAVIRVTGRVFTDDCTAPQIQSQSVAEGTAIIAGTVIDVTVAVPMRQFTMPNLLYKSQETAKQLLKNIGIDAAVEGAISEIIAKGLVAEQSIEKEQTVMPGEQVTLVVSSGSKPFAMPDVAGKTEEEARRILTESTLVVSVEYDYDQTVPEGSVIRQSVKAGADVTRGTEVRIVICSTEGLIQVLDVKGMDAEAARKTLEASGLKVMIEEVYGTDEDAGKVISQLPAAASYQKPDTTVVLTVSKGAKRTTVPNVVGMSRSEATAVLKNAGFAVKITEVYDSDSTKGKVISQSPEGGSSQKDGTTITINISIGKKPVTPSPTTPPTTPPTPPPTTPPTTPPTEEIKKPNAYTASWSNGKGYTITVKRTSSPNAHASIGILNSGATVYEGDVLSVTYNASTGYTITSNGGTSITVSGNITSSIIYATADVKSFAISWNNGNGYSIDVRRTSSPNKGAATGILKSGATVYYGDVLSVTYTASTGYNISNKGSTSITVTGNVTPSHIFCTVNVKQYTASWSGGTGYTITVKRTSSPLKGATTGELKSGATVYHGDVLSVTYTASTGCSISNKGSTSITITGNVTSSHIFCTVNVNQYTASWSGGTGYTITVKRTSSPLKGATTGELKSGATVYHGDVLTISYTRSDYYKITSHGSTTVTVTGNVTSSHIYATAELNPVVGWVKASEVPSGAQIVERKWTYTLREYKESSSSSLSGYTLYETRRTGWGATQGPVYSDPSNGERNVWSESYETGRTHYWRYYRYANSSGSAGSDKQTGSYTKYESVDLTYQLTEKGAMGNYSQGYKWYYNGVNYHTMWLEKEWDDVQYGTRWYYQEPVYTYYFYRDVNKESTSNPSGQSNVSNIVEWVKYRAK